MKKSGLDPADIRILTAIQTFGQLSKTKLAEVVNLSPTACLARLDRLKSEGFINSYHADLALNRICNFTQVIVTVSLNHHRKSNFEKFERYVQELDEVTECIATGGGLDYVMKVFVPNLEAFQDLMNTFLESDLEIERYMTYFATRRVKNGRPNIAKLVAKTSP